MQVAAARAAFDDLERAAAAARDDARRVSLDRESADHERDELSGRASAAAAERAQHEEARAAAMAELKGAEKDLDEATARALGAAAGLAAARAHADQARARDASARGALLASEEQLAALQGKSNALEALERDRVGLAPATARLLEDRASFGEGADHRPALRLHHRRRAVRDARRTVPRRHGARGAGARPRRGGCRARMARAREPGLAAPAAARRPDVRRHGPRHARRARGRGGDRRARGCKNLLGHVRADR